MLMRTEFAALIFDCDGTLVDSERLAIEVIVEMAAEHGAFFNLENAIREFRGTKMADCVASIEAARGAPVPDNFVADARARMEMRFRRDLKPIDGAEELLRSLAIPICIASNGPRTKMEVSLTVTGLMPYFKDRIFSAYDVGHWKPKPDLFLHAARALNVDAHACAVVEDSEPGVAAAIAAGMHVFALRNEYLTVDKTAQITPVNSLKELQQLFTAMDQRYS
jgi:HAD superfamily hydrolase (TIGR01509 family)